MRKPEIICETHGALESSDGYCPTCKYDSRVKEWEERGFVHRDAKLITDAEIKYGGIGKARVFIDKSENEKTLSS